MPLHPRIKHLITLANRVQRPSDEPLPVQRKSENLAASLFGRTVMRKGAPMTSITNRLVPVQGGQILVRLYRPTAGVLPLHLFIHGGGWCAGDVDGRDNRCQDLAADAGCLVASVDYRLAPENQYPVPAEDCYAALCWLVEHAEEFDVNSAAVSVGGESAGANLSAVVALMARDRKGPRLAFQMLEVPAVDLTMSQPSIDELAEGYMLTKANMIEYVRNYLPHPELVTDPYVSPLFASSHEGLPPAWIMTCEYDPLRDDGAAYAKALETAGVPVEYRMMPGHVHGSPALTRLIPEVRSYHRDAAAALRAAFRTAQTAAPASAAN
ncbi:MAG TPA: alpha/beta hydrolase [Acidimicrobiales bacterium]|jgi:acetyl esterase